jgi:HSP20 family molecular chaperone IbpA
MGFGTTNGSGDMFLNVNRGTLSQRCSVSFEVTGQDLSINVQVAGVEPERIQPEMRRTTLILTVQDVLFPQPQVVSLLRVVEPETLRVEYRDRLLCLKVRTRETAGHPKLISPGGAPTDEPCVEHPRSEKTGSDREQSS